MILPSFREIKALAESHPYTIMPLRTELLSDFTTPVEVLRKLKQVSAQCFLLESMEEPTKWGRYTFLGYDPSLEFSCLNGTITHHTESATTTTTGEPQQAIQEILAQYKSPILPGFPPFTGGLVGYFSYDYVKYAEPSLQFDAVDEEGFQDVDLMLFEKVIAFDHLKQKLILMVNMKLKGPDSLEHQYQTAVTQLEQMRAIVQHGKSAIHHPGKLTSPVRPLFSEDEFCQMVEQAKQHIREGDIFQVVLSNRLEADYTGSLLDTYRLLRIINPSPYLFYLSSDQLEIAGASPETLVKLEGQQVSTFPLAGTRPRGSTPEEDLALEHDLLQDEKELAEHNMLVDLGRNDLGKICSFGSVSVENYLSIQRFSHVMHLGSTVCGKLQAPYTALDAISAVLPAGTLSGAPKIRAMQIIDQLERNKRGIYGGAIGYLDFSGNMDTCIAIRLVFKKNGKVFIRSGAGIVYDSVSQKEYAECINKAKAVVQALQQAEGGIDG